MESWEGDDYDYAGMTCLERALFWCLEKLGLD
jgi:hypothetical protein